MNLVPKQAENSLSLSTTKQVGNSLSLPEKFRQSSQELKQVRTLTGVAMLLAMSVVISFTASVRVTETIKIGLGYLITALLGMLYGPFTAALAAGAGDLIKYLLKPDGAYFFGFTLTAMLGGVVYGVFFYREKCTTFVPCFQSNCQPSAQLSAQYSMGFLAVWNAIPWRIGTACY